MTFERPVQVGEITGVGAGQGRVDALPGLRETGRCDHAGCSDGRRAEEASSIHFRALLSFTGISPVETLEPAPLPAESHGLGDLLHRHPVDLGKKRVPSGNR
ncbi:hypothetical protein AB0399_39800 [Streptomyces sp. NPDC088194]|uniref:hypothetical protein n=1 Tax=Streptomyces sp. NPDC088194 TaxID=3154931 RepID=UPI00344BD874